MKIPRRFYNLVFSFSVAILMSFLMSFCLTAINIGFPVHFFPAWLRSWGIGFLVAFPVSLLIIPAIRRFLERFFDKPGEGPRA